MDQTTPRRRFELLVRTHHAAVYRSAMRIVRSSTDAADVTQQVFVAALEGKGVDVQSADDPGRVLCWLATRLAWNHLRSVRNRRRNEERSAMDRRESTNDITTEHAERHDERRAVTESIDALPEELRVPLVLRFQEDMTFGAVAAALECSESTAHERVQRGLDVLRKKLTMCGFAAACVRLPESIGAAGCDLAVPRGLEAELLALGKPAAVAVVSSPPVVLAIALGTIGVLAVGTVWFARGDETVVAPVGGHRVAVESDASDVDGGSDVNERRPVAPSTIEPALSSAEREGTHADHPTGWISGVVVDTDTVPLAGVRVTASSREPNGKQPRFQEMVETGVDGKFRLAVPVAYERGQDYVVFAFRQDYHVFRSETLRVEAGRSTAFVQAELRRWAVDRAGDYTLTVRATDAAGRVLPDAVVTLLRRMPEGDERQDVIESRGKTDARGTVSLQGDHFGEKRLTVDLRDAGFRLGRDSFAIGSGATHERAVALAPGLTIHGALRSVSEQPLERWLWIYATDDDGVEQAVRCAEDGSFELEGLDEKDYTLSLRGDRTSPFTLSGVAAGTRGLDLEVKRRIDSRDVGLHGPEVHGRVIDAATGEPVVMGVWDVSTHWISSEVKDWRREVLPGLLHPIVAQRAMMVEPPPPSDRFHFTGLRSGRYLVYARKKGWALSVAGPFDLTNGSETFVADIVLRLQRGATVSGSVVDSRGAPVADARVFLSTPDTGRIEDRLERAVEGLRESRGRFQVQFGGAVRTDAAGRFELVDVLPDLDLRCAALHPAHGWSASGVVRFRVGQERRGVQLQLR